MIGWLTTGKMGKRPRGQGRAVAVCTNKQVGRAEMRCFQKWSEGVQLKRWWGLYFFEVIGRGRDLF